MIDIFIPVLFMCLNGNCEFMQAKIHYRNEEKCRDSIEEQKIYMLTMVKKTGKKEFDVLEGTCINAKVDGLKGMV
jgi:hypothetical protein